ncbi:intraflagellar transport protein 81-like protein [Leptotrombidium deliense]|uniref:Intraflagellar transport protein 81-like protein n=1 Tax=Leptotrombidium deliense TaxID=299467 RepID=A0A443SVM9_9ACAR|nr:intraflagellar transport protein 81-like protein [Leptotrombidium deliense]
MFPAYNVNVTNKSTEFSPQKAVTSDVFISRSEFRENLLLGEKNTFTHIFTYLFQKMPELKKRAYLAQYLVKIAVSPDVEGDNDIVQMYNQYDALIESFKDIHMEFENLKASVESVQEVQKDIKAMEEEKEQVIEKLNNIKRKVDVHQNTDLFRYVKEFKEEKDKNEKMMRQKMQQENELQNLSQTLNKWTSEMKEIQNAYQSATTTKDLFERVEEELNTKKQLVKDVLPKELQSIQKYVHDLQEIDSQSSLGPEYLDKINDRIAAINKEINAIMEKRMLNNELMDDKLALYRQNASIVAQKKQATQNKVNEIEEELRSLKEVLKEKQTSIDGEEVLRGDSLKQYVANLRNKGNVFKQKRQELTELRTEVGIYVRSDEILRELDKQFTESLSKLEDERGISGYFTSKQSDEKIDEEKEQTLEELTATVTELNAVTNEIRTRVAPFVRDLRPLRQKNQDLEAVCQQKKSVYDSCAIGLESNADKLQQEVRRLQQTLDELQSKKYMLQCELEVLRSKEDTIREEMKYFVSTNPEDKAMSLIEKLHKEINAESSEERNLKVKRDELRENAAENSRQLKMWSDIQALFEVKSRLAATRSTRNTTQTRMDHLIL